MSESKRELNWYVLRVVSGQEKKIKVYLEKEISILGLQDFVTEVLTPTEKVYQIRKLKDGKTKKVTVDRNFFPGYVMVQLDVEHGEALHIVKSVPGVIGFLQEDAAEMTTEDGKPTIVKKPRPMRDSEINRILGKVAGTDEHEVKHEATFSVGDSIKVMDGPFNGWDGTVEEVFDEKKKLNVIVKIFGRSTPVELNYGQVQKVE